MASKVSRTPWPRSPEPIDRHEWLSFEDPDEDRTWLFDLTFLLSRWTCIFGRGCQGVLTEPAPELVQGCCSYGAHFTDDEDRTRTEEIALTLTDEEWQFRKVGRKKGVTQKQDGEWTSLLHKDACIFLNRPGLRRRRGLRAAHRRREPWPAPHVTQARGLLAAPAAPPRHHRRPRPRHQRHPRVEAARLERGGEEFAWWCTESPDAFVGGETVLSSMGVEIAAMIGQTAYDLLLTALAERTVSPLPHPAIPVTVPAPRRRRSASA